MPEKLNETYKRYLADRERLRAELRKVELSIHVLEEAGAFAYKIEDDPALRQSPEPDSTEQVTLTQQVLNIINGLAPTEKKRRSQVRKLLEANGYLSKSENFDVTLFKTLIRLMKQGRIEGTKVDNTWYFSRHSGGDTLEFA